MRKKKAFIAVFTLVACAALIGIGAIAASNLGSSDDPIVALSYLTEVLTPVLLERTKGEVEAAVDELESALQSQNTSGFAPLTLNAGQTLTLSAGSELLFRSGEAKSSEALVNLTEGNTQPNSAALAVNNLYLAAEGGCKITAVSECLLLLRGGFAIS